jgi:hypothetical protein
MTRMEDRGERPSQGEEGRGRPMDEEEVSERQGDKLQQAVDKATEGRTEEEPSRREEYERGLVKDDDMEMTGQGDKLQDAVDRATKPGE